MLCIFTYSGVAREKDKCMWQSQHTLRRKKEREIPDLGKIAKRQKLYFLKSGHARLFSVIQSENTATNTARMFNT